MHVHHTLRLGGPLPRLAMTPREGCATDFVTRCLREVLIAQSRRFEPAAHIHESSKPVRMFLCVCPLCAGSAHDQKLERVEEVKPLACAPITWNGHRYTRPLSNPQHTRTPELLGTERRRHGPRLEGCGDREVRSLQARRRGHGRYGRSSRHHGWVVGVGEPPAVASCCELA